MELAKTEFDKWAVTSTKSSPFGLAWNFLCLRMNECHKTRMASVIFIHSIKLRKNGFNKSI